MPCGRVARLGRPEHRHDSVSWELAQGDAELAATVEQYGGYMWATPGGMCDFLGYRLWNQYQTRRWVGVFTSPKGISRFCESPRRELSFDISGLEPGDCIQGGGYAENSRGKRREQTEFFGVVISNSDDRLVVKVCDSRSEALVLSHQQRSKVS